MTFSAKKVLLAVLIGVALGLTAKALFFGASDKDKIYKQLEELRQLVSKEEGEGVVKIGLDSQKLSNYFTKKATVALGEPLESASSSDEIASLFQYVKRSVDAMEVKILRKDVAVEADRKNAKMDLMIRAKIKPTVSVPGQYENEERDFAVTWQKEEKVWKISKVEMIETIKRPETY